MASTIEGLTHPWLVDCSSRRLSAPRHFNISPDASDGTSTVLCKFDELLTLHETPGDDDSTGLGTSFGRAFLEALTPGSANLAHLAQQ